MPDEAHPREVPSAVDYAIESDEICRVAEAFDSPLLIRASAIPTKYKHYTLRSRLEARWAVFFDAMGIRWEYEPEGLRTASGCQYLPDFYLPVFRWFAECKPTIELQKAEDKALRFAKEACIDVLLLTGQPDFKAYTGLHGGSSVLSENTFSLDVENFSSATDECRLWGDPDYSEKIEPECQFSARYVRAIEAARSERFGS